MAKKVTAIFVLSVFALLLVVGMAWARKQAPIPVYNYAREDGNYVTNYLLKPVGQYAFTGTILPPGAVQVGYTYYDYQHNASMTHMIGNDYQTPCVPGVIPGKDSCIFKINAGPPPDTIWGHTGSGGKHVTWMYLEGDEMTYNRFIDYNYRNPVDGLWKGPYLISNAVRRAGYTGLDIMPKDIVVGDDTLKKSREVLIFHYAVKGGSDISPQRSVLAIEAGKPGQNTFWLFDIPDSAANFKEGGMWPHASIDTLDRIHVVMPSGETSAGVSWFGYTRCQEIAGTDSILCESPGYSARIKKDVFTTAAKKMVASLAQSGTSGMIVAASPKSQKVAIVWTHPVMEDHSYFQVGNDIYYLESKNGGQDWIGAGSFSGFTPVNITRFAPEDNYKAYDDLDAIYDYNDSLHIFYNVHRLNTATGEGDPDDVALMHWSKATTGQLCGSGADTLRIKYNVVNAGWWDAVPGAWNRNMAKMTAGVGVPNESNYNWLYLAWTQFDTGDVADNGYTNGEIYVSVSTDFGKTWDAAHNVTNSHTPGCLPPNCDSDHWGSMAARVDSFLYLEWVNDKDAGGVPQDEGSFTQNPILYYQYSKWTPTALPRIDWVPKDYSETWVNAKNNSTATRKLLISNIGSANLTINSITETAPWLDIGTYSSPILPGGCPNNITLTFNASGGSEKFLTDSINILSDDAFGHSSVWDRVYAIYSDVYQPFSWVNLTNGTCDLTETNLGNIANQRKGMGWSKDDTVNFIYDGSIILGQSASTPRVGRFIFNERNLLAGDTLKVDTLVAAGLYAKIIKKRYAPMNPKPPEWDYWWCWGVEEYDVLFSSGLATSDERYMLLQYVKVFHQDRPAWWLSAWGCKSSVPDLYVGEAFDFDLESDTGNSFNFPHFDEELNLLYQQGMDTLGAAGKPHKRFAGVALHDPDLATPVNPPTAYGGHLIRNDEFVYPHEGFADDSLYMVMSTPGFSIWPDTYTVKLADYSSVLTADTILGHSLPDTNTWEYRFMVVVSINDDADATTLKNRVRMTACGNVDRDPVPSIDLGDVIMLAKYSFGIPGFNPWLYMGDVNGDCEINLGDVVHLAKYCFGIPGYPLTCNCGQSWD